MNCCKKLYLAFNTAWGRHYSREFGKWMKANGFDLMPKSTRSVTIELHENANAIEAWRATLPERQRKRLVHPFKCPTLASFT
jgi:hypothetical protein